MFASFFKTTPMPFKALFFAFLAITLISCGGSSDTAKNKSIDDLPFATTTDAKVYSDLILRSIKTNRDKPLFSELATKTAADASKLNKIVAMYSTGIGGRDWDFYDIHELSGSDNDTEGFDYAWLDQRGRLGLQIRIIPVAKEKGFALDKIEFRSRIEIMESVAIPGGDTIDDYKKIEYEWASTK